MILEAKSIVVDIHRKGALLTFFFNVIHPESQNL